MTKSFLALARVRSREQAREGFSLDVQVDAFERYATREQGRIVKLFRIAETASKRDERRAFQEMLAYAKKHSSSLDGLLFYKVDRAARNLFDYVELERFEEEFGVPVLYISQPTENTPAGRMQRRILANLASFFTEQQSLDVREGLGRRVQSGLFIGKAPYGYRNFRIDGRSLIEVDPENAPKVRRIYDLYAYQGCTLDSPIQKLADEGVEYSKRMFRFNRAKVHTILRDRAYIGEVQHQGQWFPGVHEPLVDRATWDRVQVLMGDKVYLSHEMVYASELIRCAHCDHFITGERKFRDTKRGRSIYTYYRCGKYTASGHPRIRIAEEKLDEQILALFGRIRIQDEQVRDWFLRVLRARTRETQQVGQNKIADLNRQLTSLRSQQDRLLNLRLLDEIDETTFSSKSTELRDRIAKLSLELEACDRGRAERAELAEKAFELSQSLADKWVKADVAAIRQLLQIVCLNFSLDSATLIPEIRKPFDILAEGLSVSFSRGDRI